MVIETVLYLAMLSSIAIFMLLVDTKLRFVNKVLIALSAPIVGSLFVVLGTIFLLFMLALIIFGGLMILINKRRFKRWMQERHPLFGHYRYYSLF